MPVHRKKTKINDAVEQDMTGRHLGIKQINPATKLSERDPMVLTGFRIGRNHRNLLRGYFAEKGLELGTGIRSVLYEYMKREGIR